MRVKLVETETAPASPGVYRFWNEALQILYVGKAVNLRKRLAQYRSGRESEQRANIALLFKHPVEVDWIVTPTEKDALILEDTLIKEHRPRYNIRMRDDKTYVHLRLTREHAFPRLIRVRRPQAHLKGLMGPFPSGWHVKQLQQVVQRVFPIRTCTDAKFRNRSRPCLEHQIGRCSAPCVGRISQEDYAAIVEDVRAFLQGENTSLLRKWRTKMEEASKDMRYEEAARFRDLIQAAESVWQTQSVDVRSEHTLDAIAFAWDGARVCIAVTSIANGVVVQNRLYGPMKWQGEANDVIEQFLMQFYTRAYSIPSLVLLNGAEERLALVAEILSERRGKQVDVRVPKRGENRKRLVLANMQAEQGLGKEGSALQRVHAVEKLLRLEEGSLQRVECFDISEHHGDAAVGADVVFLYGEPAPELYRKYKIRLQADENDFAKMHEMLQRRIRRAVESSDMPDLMVIDGGKGQLNAVLAAFHELEVDPPMVVGLAKARSQFEGERSQERIFLPGRSNPVVLKPGSAARLFFEQIRDETHRFAITYHRKHRTDQVLKGIEGVAGIGPGRRRAILQAYSNLEQLRYESAEQVASRTGVPLKVAENVVEYMKGESTQ